MGNNENDLLSITARVENKCKQIDNDMNRMYLVDQKVHAGVWFFDPEIYVETTMNCANMISDTNIQITNAVTAMQGVIGNLKSPEGKDIEGNVTSCFENIIANARGVVSGISYIMRWNFDRYCRGIQASQISMSTVESINSKLGIRYA